MRRAARRAVASCSTSAATIAVVPTPADDAWLFPLTGDSLITSTHMEVTERVQRKTVAGMDGLSGDTDVRPVSKTGADRGIRMEEVWSRLGESNPRPFHYE